MESDEIVKLPCLKSNEEEHNVWDYCTFLPSGDLLVFPYGETKIYKFSYNNNNGFSCSKSYNIYYPPFAVRPISIDRHHLYPQRDSKCFFIDKRDNELIFQLDSDTMNIVKMY